MCTGDGGNASGKAFWELNNIPGALTWVVAKRQLAILGQYDQDWGSVQFGLSALRSIY